MKVNNYADWPCDQIATLVFCIEQENVLLIHKKRGLGAGKINGPGGKLEPGENLLACAIRETAEETGIRIQNATTHGVLCFSFIAGLRLRVHIFVAKEFSGLPKETEEARPFWQKIDQIPYHNMWADDALWLPHVLAGGQAFGHFNFDDDQLLSYELDLK